MDWRQFIMELGQLPAEPVEVVLERHGAQAVTLSDAGDDPVLEPGRGETPLWPATRIAGLFAPDTDFDALRADLVSTFALEEMPAHRVEVLADRPWEREWLKDFGPMQFGERLWVCPAGMRPDSGDAVIVELDPGLAFGTGTHPTTALCLEWLEGLDLAGKRVLDFGCGSGILAIAALKLGARSAVGIDIDPQALTATASNARRNGVGLQLAMRPEGIDDQFDVVLANILAAPLRDSAGWLSARLTCDGRLALSGILAAQASAVAEAYRRHIEFEPPANKDGWVRLSGRRLRD
ncbi:MAG: 50S ribosomal protein L11 methyltransferase [Woeseiaceae bacterium]|nr:50S ribosomal protein L11 methyltransferase [Woeseiaceae bacterium]